MTSFLLGRSWSAGRESLDHRAERQCEGDALHVIGVCFYVSANDSHLPSFVVFFPIVSMIVSFQELGLSIPILSIVSTIDVIAIIRLPAKYPLVIATVIAAVPIVVMHFFILDHGMYESYELFLLKEVRS